MSNLNLCIVRIYYSVLSILVWTLNDFVLTQLFFFAIYRKPVSLIKYAFRLQFMFPIWSICFDFWMILCFTFYISLHFFFFSFTFVSMSICYIFLVLSIFFYWYFLFSFLSVFLYMFFFFIYSKHQLLFLFFWHSFIL